MMQVKRMTALLLILALALVVAACGAARKPLPPGEQPISPAPGGGDPTQTVPAAIFFADAQAQHLIPERHQVSDLQGAALATQIVKELMAGPEEPHLGRTLPTGVKLLEPVTVENGIAYVNLSQELTQVQGSAGANMALGSLRLSLTEVPGIEKVQVLVEGKKSEHFEGMMLEPLDRGLYPHLVLPNPDRAAYLQGRVEKGLDTWRADAREVFEWEGRMFGFTAAELQAAELHVTEYRALGTLTRGKFIYTIELHRLGQTAPFVWTAVGIGQREEAAERSAEVALYFSDWQAQHVIPERRAVPWAAEGGALATRVVEGLIGGPIDPHLYGALPGVRLLEPVTVDNGLARVNLSAEFARIPGSTGARAAVQSVVQSLTDLQGISQVQFLVEGSQEIEQDHMTITDPIHRSLATYPPIPDPERISYLQEQADKGAQAWRRDVQKVLVWEGRMFGFTGEELKTASASLKVDGPFASAQLEKASVTYTIRLSLTQNVTGIWVIDEITEQR